MYAIQNNSSFLGLYELVDEFTSPAVEHLPRVDDSRLRKGTYTHTYPQTLQLKSVETYLGVNIKG